VINSKESITPESIRKDLPQGWKQVDLGVLLPSSLMLNP
jgi:hypothetical protein